MIGRPDPTRAAIAAKSCLALVIGLWIGLRLQWRMSYLGIVIIVLQTAALGSTVTKGLLYLAGTGAGAATALAMIGLFARQRAMFIAAMAILTGAVVYKMLASKRPYVWLVFNITTNLIAWSAAQDTANAFPLAVMRASTIAVGVVVTFAVHGILWPIRAGATFERQLRAAIEGCATLLAETARNKIDADCEKAMGPRIDQLHQSLAAAAGDTTRFRRFEAGYRKLIDQVYDLLLSILILREQLRCRAEPLEAESLRPLDTSATTLGHAVEGARNRAQPPEPTPRGKAEGNDIAAGVHAILNRVAQVCTTLAGVEDPRHPPPAPAPRPRAQFSIRSDRFAAGLRASVAMLAVVLLFIRINWPQGLQLAMIFVTVAVTLAALLPMLVISRRTLVSLLIAPAIAGVLYFGIMPGVNRYSQLAPWLVAAFFPLLYFVASPNGRTSTLALTSAIFTMILIGLDEAQQYSFATFVNNWIGLCGGFALTIAILAVLSAQTSEREFAKGVRAFFDWAARRLGRLGDSSSAASVAERDEWHKIRARLHRWSATLTPRKLGPAGLRAAGDLTRSIEHVALRIGAVEQARSDLDGEASESLARLRDDCAAMGNQVEQPTAKPAAPVDIPAGPLTSLAAALADTRARVNAIDWAAWIRNYF